MNLPQEQPTLKSGSWMGRLACNKRKGQYTGQVIDCHLWRKDELNNDWHRAHEKKSWIMRNDQLLTHISMWSFQEQLQAENLEGMSTGVTLMSNLRGRASPKPQGNSLLCSKSMPATNFLVTFYRNFPVSPVLGRGSQESKHRYSGPRGACLPRRGVSHCIIAVCLYSPVDYELFEGKDYVTSSLLSKVQRGKYPLTTRMNGFPSAIPMSPVSHRTLSQWIRKELLGLWGWGSDFTMHKGYEGHLWDLTCTTCQPTCPPVTVNPSSSYPLLLRAEVTDALCF